MKIQAQNVEERTPKLLDQVRNLMRLHHYSIHTERSYVDWIRRFIRFHQMRTRADLPIAALFPSVFISVHPWLICLFMYAHLCRITKLPGASFPRGDFGST